MNDPHVEALHYNLKPEASTKYDAPPAVTFSTATFDGVLESEKIIVKMTQHFPSEAEARSNVEPFLKAWEISASLEHGRDEFRFEFDHSDIVDRSPPPPGEVHVHAVLATGKMTFSGTATAVLVRKLYTAPLQGFSATPMVELLWNRFKRHLQGSEPIYSMAYFCLTVLEKQAGDRKRLSTKYSIDMKVLNTIGELSTNRGSETDARKMPKGGLKPPTSNELVWLNSAMRQMILQVGLVESGSRPPRLSMGKLPKL